MSQLCLDLRAKIAVLLAGAYEQDLDAILTARGQELWLLGIDSPNQRYIDICGTVSPQMLAAIQARFIDADAGWRVEVQNVFSLQGRKADVFLLNADYFSASPARLEPLIVHELAHFLEQIGADPAMAVGDEANAAAIMKSLTPNISRLHTIKWARHLASGARRLIEKDLTEHRTVRKFLEAAE